MAAIAPNDPDSWIEQSYAHNSLGSLELQRGHVDRAVKEFERSVELKSRATAQRPSDKTLAAGLADSLSWLASANLQLGQLEQAGNLYAKELSVLQALYDASRDDKSLLKLLASAWLHQAEIKQLMGDVPDSTAYLVKAKEILEILVRQDPGNRSWQRDLYIAELKMFDVTRQNLDRTAALTLLDRLQTGFSGLSKFEPTKLNLQMLVSGVIQRRAMVEFTSGNTRAAHDILKPALSELQKIHALAPTDQLLRNYLFDALLLDADISRSMNDLALANRSCHSAKGLLPASIQNIADFNVISQWIKVSLCLGDYGAITAPEQQLRRFQFKDPSYLDYLSTHQPKKGTL